MVGLHALGMVNALGADLTTISAGLFNEDVSRLRPFHLRTTGAEVPVGMVSCELPLFDGEMAVYDCRNHRLAYAAYIQIREAIHAACERFGRDRVAVVVGSSTAGLDATEQAYAQWHHTGSLPPRYNYKKQHAMGSVARVIADMAGVQGPAYTLSTACTSSVKAMVSARGLLEAGFCDAVVTGGVDTLCHLTVNGFEALGAVSREVSIPMSRNRAGLNIGEGAALFLMTREPATVFMAGAGESCDAHHMSAPQPEGLGAEAAMRLALEDAGLKPEAIAYLNLHGTGTPLNDSMESQAVHRLFANVPCSSTKPMVGHCLGAAGAIEAGFCWLTLTAGIDGVYPLPPHHWDGVCDADIPSLRLVRQGATSAAGREVYTMSNSFAFGGNNCSIILGRKG